jgi:hypothetical protein
MSHRVAVEGRGRPVSIACPFVRRAVSMALDNVASSVLERLDSGSSAGPTDGLTSRGTSRMIEGIGLVAAPRRTGGHPTDWLLAGGLIGTRLKPELKKELPCPRSD